MLRLSSTPFLCLAAVLTLTGAKASPDAQPPVEAIPVEGQVAEAVEAPENSLRRPSFASKTLLADMAAARADLQETLAKLNEELTATTDQKRAIALQHEIQKAKLENELRYFEIQASHARRVGNLPLAEAAEKQLKVMKQGVKPATKESVDQ